MEFSQLMIGLAGTLAALCTLAAVFIAVDTVLPPAVWARFNPLVKAIFMVAAVLLTLAAPLAVAPGVIIDVRGAIVAAATLFGGPWVGLITVLAGAFYRWLLGGAGAIPGVLGFVAAYLACLALVHGWARYAPARRRPRLLILGAGVAVGCTEALSLLLIAPPVTGWQLFITLGPMLALAQLLGTVLLGSLLDLLEQRQQAQQAIADRERQWRTLWENTQDALFITDIDSGHIVDVNPAAVALLGHSHAALVGCHYSALVPPLWRTQAAPYFTRTTSAPLRLLDIVLQHADGHAVTVEATSGGALRLGEREVVFSSFRDSSERHRTRQILDRLDWTQAVINRCVLALLGAQSEAELYRTLCAALTYADAYACVGVGEALLDESRSIRIVAASGSQADYLHGIELRWDDSPLGQGPYGEAIRCGQPQASAEITAQPACMPWWEAARHHGIQSLLAVPLRIGGQVFGVLLVHSRNAGAFGATENVLFQDLANSLGYGVAALRTQAALKHAQQERLEQEQRRREILQQTIAAVASIIERRDPYTGGHQQRVAGLAVAIAAEMGLDADRIEGLRLASVVHDLGKIQVPAEILVKPSRLSPIEYALIKLHPQAGYDVLAGIPFPWPIAEMVLQHHERLDGSGYPLGLHAEQILLEARILSVADIVESMSSHRPYRPALGVETALAAIAAMRGTQLDPMVVDACTRLFHERGYHLDLPAVEQPVSSLPPHLRAL